MEHIWELIAPYVAAAGGFTGLGAIAYIAIRSLLTKLTQKNTSALSELCNVDKLAQKVAEKMAGKTLNIDVTAVTEKALKKLSAKMDGKITDIAEITGSYKHLLALIGAALSKLKALTPDEVKELTAAIQALESGYTPPEPEQIMTVRLDPIEVETADEEETPTGGVNFEGLK